MPPTPIIRGTQVTYQGIPYTVRSVDGNVLALESDDGHFCRFAHVSSVIVCPPPAAAPAVDSLPAPAAAVQGAGIHSYLWHQVFLTDPVGQWLCMSFSRACPTCGFDPLQPLCHLPPDPQFICDGCGGTFAADLSPCSDMSTPAPVEINGQSGLLLQRLQREDANRAAWMAIADFLALQNLRDSLRNSQRQEAKA
ncbi:hypothetical protein GCM10022279_17810 [Comamonas faecalis]|uniref:Transposase n=1 Tax=Comamonas faecalis TaxID=1387849 RepID=A0ABP7RBJ6_9BURK